MEFITREELLNHLEERMMKQIFKLLPIYEGKGFYDEVIATPLEALSNYHQQIVVIETELQGMSNFSDIDMFKDLVFLVSGMKNFSIGQHEEVKTCVFRAMNLCKQIAKIYRD